MSTQADITTRCPHCQVAFKATKENLAVANGNVRCGFCLNIFNANVYAFDYTGTPNAIETRSAEIKNQDIQADEHQSAEPQDKKNQQNALSKTLKAPIDKFILESYANRPQPKSYFWGIGSLCLSFILIGQVAWLRFDTLSRHAPYRDYYQYVCEYLPCTLPLQSNTEQIKISHLVIRAHPVEKNALIADAIIVNKAIFAQAYPALQLEFRDIHNTVVAQRDFQPTEYLKGALLGATVMPVQQSVQLSLAILAPSDSAISYRINIIPAAQ